jgi:hypothetical protein
MKMTWQSRVKSLINGRLGIVLVVLSYVFFTVMYMGPSVTQCNNTLYGFGDNTAGPVWRFSIKPSQPPLGSYTDMTNFPVGENFYSPANYSQYGQAILIWSASRIAGPVCGYNLVNMAGFIASALVMFGFIYSVTRKRSIAWLAGFAVSFSPYYQMKVGGHPGYGYQALLIGSVWAFYNVIKYRRRRDIVWLAVLTSLSLYFDPYFSLLIIFMLVPLGLVWLALVWQRTRKKVKKQSFKTQIMPDVKAIIKAVLLCIILIAPLLFVTVKNSRQISTTVAAVRGNVVAEAAACSNLPYEYLIPSGRNKILEKLTDRTTYTATIQMLHNNYSCGIGEDTVGVSLAVLSVATIGLIIFGWERINKRRLGLKLGYDNELVIYGMVAIAVAAAIIALPPLKIGGLIPTPSFILLAITPTWRTLTRMYVDVNFAIITIFAVVLWYVSVRFAKHKKLLGILFVGLFLTIFVEYLAFKPFKGNDISTFSYKTNVPTPYTWLGEQENISTIAEYPIEKSGGESNAMAYYLTMQLAHKKKLFNANIPTTKEENLRTSLKDISDPQTVQVLSAMKIDAVVIHGVPEETVRAIPGLEVIYSAPHQRFNMSAFTPLITHDNVVIARITAPKTVQMLSLAKNFVRNTTIIKSAADWNYEALNNSRIDVIRVPGQDVAQVTDNKRCFDIKIAGQTDKAAITISADGKPFITVPADGTYQSMVVPANKTITLTNDKGYNMEVRNLGCSTAANQ